MTRKVYLSRRSETLTKRIPVSLALLSEVAPQENRLKYISYKQNEEQIEVSVDNKFGFKDIKGDIVIEPQYDRANSFCNGLAVVQKKLHNNL